jgi:hypothetical protein
MASIMHPSLMHHDDLDMMGLQELDSAMSIFESSHAEGSQLSRASSYDTPSSQPYMSPYSQTITVHVPDDHMARTEELEDEEMSFTPARSVYMSNMPPFG